MLNRRNKPAHWCVFPATRQILHRRQETPLNTVRLCIPVALLLALLLAGCGGSAPASSPTAAPAAAAPTAAPAAAGYMPPAAGVAGIAAPAAEPTAAPAAETPTATPGARAHPPPGRLRRRLPPGRPLPPPPLRTIPAVRSSKMPRLRWKLPVST